MTTCGNMPTEKRHPLQAPYRRPARRRRPHKRYRPHEAASSRDALLSGPPFAVESLRVGPREPRGGRRAACIGPAGLGRDKGTTVYKAVLVLALLALVCGTGCSARRCGDLPTVDAKTIVPPDPKPSVDYHAEYPRFADTTPQADWLRDHADRVFEQSRFFSRVSRTHGTGDYHFKLIYVDEDLRPEKSPDAIGAGLTFGFIPLWHTSDVTLRVEVSRKEKVLRTYVYHDQVEIFCWTVVGWAGVAFQSKAVADELVDDMLLSLLRDLSRDRLLEAPKSP